MPPVSLSPSLSLTLTLTATPILTVTLTLRAETLTLTLTHRWDVVFSHGAHVVFGLALSLLAAQEVSLLALHHMHALLPYPYPHPYPYP